MPGEGWTNKPVERWRDFLGGEWLDVWVAHHVQAVLPDARVYASVNVRRDNGRDFQVDVVAIRSHQVRVVSCTTDPTLEICKNKAFEVEIRARQLGGDLASAALACFLDGKHVDDVGRDIESIWDEPDVTKVFGLGHLRDWRAGQRQSLIRWATQS
jgi:hypothetical protein